MHGWALGVGVQEPPTHEYLTQVFKMIGNTLDHDTPDTVSNRKRVAATAECIAEDHNAIIQLLDALEAAERRIADLEKTCAMQGTRFS